MDDADWDNVEASVVSDGGRLPDGEAEGVGLEGWQALLDLIRRRSWRSEFRQGDSPRWRHLDRDPSMGDAPRRRYWDRLAGHHRAGWRNGQGRRRGGLSARLLHGLPMRCPK